MKIFKALLIVVGLLVTTQTFAQNYAYKQDAFDKEKVNILDNYGNKVGYYKVDALTNQK